MHSPRVILAALFCMTAPLMRNASAAAEAQQALTFKQPVTKTLGYDYLLSLPTGPAPADGRWPLILFLHGAGERGSDVWKVAKHGPAKLAQAGAKLTSGEQESAALLKEKFILVSPQCPAGQNWDDATVMALLDHVMSELKVDTSRVYLTGLSMGGFATWRLGLRYPARFAAIVPVCGGNSYLDTIFALGENKSALRKLGIWAFHGAKDPVVPLEESQRLVDALKKNNAVTDLTLTIFPEAKHDSWTEAYAKPEVFRWLLEHHR
jgi:predicted peptidase